MACRQGLALLTLYWDKNWDSHSLVIGYPSFYPRIALVAPSPGRRQAIIWTNTGIWCPGMHIYILAARISWHITAILLVIFSNSFSRMNVLVWCFKFRRNLFPGVQWTFSQHWSKWLLIGTLWTNFSEFKHFHSRKYILKCRLENGGILPRPQCVTDVYIHHPA